MSALTIDKLREQLTAERDALQRQLRWIEDSLIALDDIVKGVLDGAPVIKVERGPAADTVIVDDPPPATTAEAKRTGNRRRFTDEEKHLAVREAESGVSDASVERRLELAAGSINRWRKAGYGKKPVAMGGSITGTNPGQPTKAKTAGGPSARCPVCKALVPIEDPTQLNARDNALLHHLDENPSCMTAVRKAGAK
ncbi:transposase [Haloactinopolyspora sp.]|uniref:transposase n=1 Tax=Haloactinopolyspora sp. TaxID=1966353 RepID=UPI00262CBF95|nr:transposase [Haloactinopolyspora sp.]